MRRTFAADESVRQRVRGETLGQLGAVAALAVALTCLTFAVVQLVNVTRPVTGTPLALAQWWRSLNGTFTPSLALDVNVVLVALVATINVAVAVDNRHAKREDVVASDVWRTFLGYVMTASAGGAVVFGLSQVASVRSHGDVGTAVAAATFAALTVFIAISSVRYGHSANRVRRFMVCDRKLRALSVWADQLRYRGVTVSLSGARSSAAAVAAGAAGRIAIAGLMSAGYTVTVLAAWRAATGSGSFTWQSARLVLLVFLYSSALAYVAGWMATQRWSVVKTRFVHWRLDILPRLYLGLYLALSTLLLWLFGAAEFGPWRGSALLVLLAGPFLVTPVVVWVVLRPARRIPSCGGWLHRRGRSSSVRSSTRMPRTSGHGAALTTKKSRRIRSPMRLWTIRSAARGRRSACSPGSPADSSSSAMRLPAGRCTCRVAASPRLDAWRRPRWND
jgi:hypothetical protein